MDARTKALRAHRKRLQARRMKRIEVTLHEQDAALIRRLAADLRRNDANAGRLRFVLRGALAEHRGTRIAEALYDPVIAGAGIRRSVRGDRAVSPPAGDDESAGHRSVSFLLDTNVLSELRKGPQANTKPHPDRKFLRPLWLSFT
jgi:hypothetical protein